ncbi:MAG: hypothetical protein MI922_14425, partial [Bacteroidales bacterium]|nr:hypothetical protein [Bacteroidales bacterium]
YKKKNETWTDAFTIPKDSLKQAFYDYNWNVSGLFDGSYKVRSKATCSSGKDVTYSSEQEGIIDRKSVAPFGTPSPTDGFLRRGQDIIISFDQQVDCDFQAYDPGAVIVVNKSGDTIPSSLQCFENQIIIVPDTPLKDRTDLDGDTLTATVSSVKDLVGNQQKYPVEWSFIANESPVIWTNDTLNTSQSIDSASAEQSLAEAGLKAAQEKVITLSIDAGLWNRSSITKAYSLDKNEYPGLVQYPSWLTPVAANGTILPNSITKIDFTVNPGLEPGIYKGEVTAVIDGFPETMSVVYELLPSPPAWDVDPANYKFNMNIITQFTLTSDDSLSVDTRDLVAAVVNGEIRGIANIQYVPSTDSYVAFLTVHSNESHREKVSFRIWQALTGIEYGAKEEV